jgi:folate-binding protein YgfZ
MPLTPLQGALTEQSSSAPLRLADYRGSTTAAAFGDLAAEYSALRTGCGVYDLGFLARMALTGTDRTRWLNGMVTNNIRDLAGGRGVYAFLLNPQGRILGDLYAYNHGESVFVDTDRSQTEKILATFDHYIVMDDVEVSNLGESVTALGVAGPSSRDVLCATGFMVAELLPLQMQDMNWQGSEITVVRGDDAHESYEIWVAPGQAKQLWDALLVAGGTAVGSDALELQRIVAGTPVYGIDIRERDLPQETEQVRALNFNKGCYVGQEIVERIRSRGAVHRKFTGFVIEGNVPITGTKIVAGEKEVGEITSAVSLHALGAARTLALGYIRREVGTAGRDVLIGTANATVVQLPLESVALGASERSLLQA